MRQPEWRGYKEITASTSKQTVYCEDTLYYQDTDTNIQSIFNALQGQDVKQSNTSDHFYQYSVAFFYEDRNPVEPKGVGRKVLDMVYKRYKSDMGGKGFAYDGEKTLLPVGPLPMNKLEFTVILEYLSSNRTVRGSPNRGDTKRSWRPPQSKQYTMKRNYATKILIQSIFNALQGQDSEQFNEAIRVLDVLLRQHACWL